MRISVWRGCALSFGLCVFALTAHADVSASGGAIGARPVAGLPSNSLFVSPLRPPIAARPAGLPTTAGPAATPGMQCRQAIRAAEVGAGIPNQLMAAIGRIESGRRDAQGQINPWPWSINVEGTDHIYETRAEVIAAVQTYQAQGKRSIDVGCMQVNLMYHPNAFATLDQAFDPATNARYAAKYLRELFTQTGTWEKATAYYHSANPEHGTPYQQKVAAVLPEEQKRSTQAPGTNVWSNNVWTQNAWNTPGAVPTAGGFRLSNRAENAKLLPAAPGTIGRPLAAYRANATAPNAAVTR